MFPAALFTTAKGGSNPAVQRAWHTRATRSSTLAWTVPWSLVGPWGHKASDTTECTHTCDGAFGHFVQLVSRVHLFVTPWTVAY